MTRPLTNDDLATILDTRKEIHFGSPEWLALRALVAEVRASRQHASGGGDVLTAALDLLNLYHDALDDATAGGFSIEILWSMGEGGDVWRLMRERRLAVPPTTRTHKADTIEIDDGWYTGTCECGWRAIAQRLRRVDALKDADTHVRVASKAAPSPPAPVEDAPSPCYVIATDDGQVREIVPAPAGSPPNVFGYVDDAVKVVPSPPAPVDDAPKRSTFFGPCAHGRDPYTRCDVCGELSEEEAEALAKKGAPVEDARPVLGPWEDDDLVDHRRFIDGARGVAITVARTILGGDEASWIVWHEHETKMLCRSSAPLPSTAAAKAAADAAARRYYRLPDDAPDDAPVAPATTGGEDSNA